MSDLSVSFEFFPPQSLDASFRLWDSVQQLAPLDPTFVSVTYGAGGTTRQLTHEAVEAIQRHYRLNVAAHLTCVDATRAQTQAIAKRYADAGVREIVALRGDPPKGSGGFEPHPEGYRDSCALIRDLAALEAFHIRVGAYPDPHPEASDDDADVRWLRAKQEAGADSAITQFFFEADTFFRFRDRAVAAGVTIPILPGILPIENWAGTARFAARCGAKVPAWVGPAFDKADRDGRNDLLGVALCTELCSDLIEGGVDHLHFYTLNKPEMTRQVTHALGLAPETVLRDVA
ncbi:MAG: methylenetetrahydrofolate reductase [NAD(P)H] [Pseudomonadota bacterium]